MGKRRRKSDRSAAVPGSSLQWKPAEGFDSDALFALHSEGLVMIEELDGDLPQGSAIPIALAGQNAPQSALSDDDEDEEEVEEQSVDKTEETNSGDAHAEAAEPLPDSAASRKRARTGGAQEARAASEPSADESAAAEPDSAALDAWREFDLHSNVLRGIEALGFAAPTPIQAAALPPAIKFRKSVIGAAQTGSGKTLSFALPILHAFSSEPRAKSGNLLALILAPTRELANQVVEHIQEAARFCPGFSVVSVVGGLSVQKQQRLLRRNPSVVVGTPGRLWDLMDHFEEKIFQDLSSLRFLVVDEADRMVEKGHFEEAGKIIDRVCAAEPRKLQSFVYSATLAIPKVYSGKNRTATEHDAALQELVDAIPFTRKPEIIDLTPQTKVATSISQRKLECVEDTRESYLYYILLNRRNGRSIVFVNAISYLRRLRSLLSELQLPVHVLHSGMQQRQRLKHLERFAKDDSGILVATDVAARGLDIPDVDLVIHHQIPRGTDAYVHRCGRAGRAGKNGYSIALVAPEERVLFRRIVSQVLNGNEPPAERLDHRLLEQAKTRLSLAKQIDAVVHAQSRERAKQQWEDKTLSSMERAVDNDEEDPDDPYVNLRLSRKEQAKISRLRSQLAEKLGESLRGRTESIKTKNPLERAKEIQLQRLLSGKR